MRFNIDALSTILATNKADHVTWILTSDWSRLITWLRYWPLIGRDRVTWPEYQGAWLGGQPLLQGPPVHGPTVPPACVQGAILQTHRQPALIWKRKGLYHFQMFLTLMTTGDQGVSNCLRLPDCLTLYLVYFFLQNISQCSSCMHTHYLVDNA